MFTLTSEKASRRSGFFIILRAKSVVFGEKSKKIKNTLLLRVYRRPLSGELRYKLHKQYGYEDQRASNVTNAAQGFTQKRCCKHGGKQCF